MKKFLLFISAFLALVLSCLALYEKYVDYYYKHSNVQCFIINKIFTERIDADILIIGNSRAQAHYSPLVLDSILQKETYNIGVAGYPLDLQYHCVLQPYLNQNKRPQLVIIDVGLFACFEDVNPVLSTIFLPFIDKKEYNYYIERCPDITYVDKYLPIKYRGQALPSLQTERIKNSEKGFFTHDSTLTYRDNFNREHYDLESNEIIIAEFYNMLNYLQQNDITFVLVCSPYDYEDVIQKCEYQQFIQWMDSVSGIYNTPFLSYAETFKGERQYFREATHMNRKGAELFTTRLAHDLDSLHLLH